MKPLADACFEGRNAKCYSFGPMAIYLEEVASTAS